MPEKNGRRDNAGKPATHLLPAAALMEIAQVFEFGAKKYSPNNYRKGLPWTTYTGSLLRHVFLWTTGEEIDPESGLNHIAHAGCNVLMLLDAIIHGHGTDDRWRPNGSTHSDSDG